LSVVEPERTPGTRESRPAKRERILGAAIDVFRDMGFEATRMDEVARRARVGKGTLYNFFDSKEDLLISAWEASMESSRMRIDSLIGPVRGDPEQALSSLLHSLFLDLLPRIRSPLSLQNQLWGVMARDPEARRRVLEFQRRFFRAREREITETIERGRASGAFRTDIDSREIALLLLAVFDGVVYRTAFDDARIDAGRALASFERLLDGGLGRSGGDGS
jgi:AcrR family transcriptional regulator